MEETEKKRSILEIVGENIKYYREEAGISKTEFGAFFGTRGSRTTMIENGMANLQLSTLSKIATYLGVTVIDLVEDWEGIDRS